MVQDRGAEPLHVPGQGNAGTELRKENLSYKQLSRTRTGPGGQGFSLPGEDDLLAAIGFGKISARQVAGKSNRRKKRLGSDGPGGGQDAPPPKEGIKVKGVVTSDPFRRLLQPLAGEAIVGYITQGGSDRAFGPLPERDEGRPERRIDVDWIITEGTTYPVRIQWFHRTPRALAELSGAIAAANVNITNASIEVTPENKGISEFTIQVATGNTCGRSCIALKS
jgi:GTP pyrophosphokinase